MLVGNLTETETLKIASSKPAYVTAKKKTASPMAPQTRQFLENLYRPHNLELTKILNDPTYLWEDGQAHTDKSPS
jgi:hypothetical protein